MSEFLNLEHRGQQICATWVDESLYHRLAQLATQLNTGVNEVAIAALSRGLDGLEIVVAEQRSEGTSWGQSLRAKLALAELEREAQLVKDKLKLGETLQGRLAARRHGVKLEAANG